jgi:N-acetylglucosaminyldiphosphoundecaprenol N-acetyl-beta-D-mannosaminyltransferase
MSDLLSLDPARLKPENVERVEFVGVRCDNLTMSEALTRIDECIGAGCFSYAVTPNVDHVMKLQQDGSLRSIYRDAHFVLPDGVPLLWASAILGTPLKERVNGTDLLEGLCQIAAKKDYSVYFLGGSRGTAEKAATILAQRYPGLRVAGWHCPELGFEKKAAECEALKNRIATAHPDILFVALGAPKQEEWIHQYGAATGAAFAVGIGISFSLIAGEIRRAPRWMQRRGLEWFWRLCSEPRRLWKRYLLDDLPFIRLVAREYLARHSLAKSSPARFSQ